MDSPSFAIAFLTSRQCNRFLGVFAVEKLLRTPPFAFFCLNAALRIIIRCRNSALCALLIAKMLLYISDFIYPIGHSSAYSWLSSTATCSYDLRISSLRRFRQLFRLNLVACFRQLTSGAQVCATFAVASAYKACLIA